MAKDGIGLVTGSAVAAIVCSLFGFSAAIQEEGKEWT